MVFVPLAAEKPALAEVVELIHVYVYDEPLPPVGVEPVNALGVEPEQMVCAPLAVLPVIPVVTVICTAADVSAAHAPEVALLLNQVFWVSAAGA